MTDRPMAKADLHLHTDRSGWRHMRLIHPKDCYVPPAQAYRAALDSGMTYVAVTDHDSVEGALALLETPGVDPEIVIVGEEVECRFPETGQWVHVSVLGLSEADHRRIRRLTADVREVCAYCREAGLLHVLNHPFQSFRWQKPLEAYLEDVLGLFTHVEGLNGCVPSAQNRAVSALCARAASEGRRLVQVGGSDAHTVGRVGSAYTEARASSAREFLDEIRAGRCSVGGRVFSTAALLADVYRNIWTYHARLYTGRGEAGSPAAYAVDAAVATACLPATLGGLPAAIVLGNQARQNAVSRCVLSALASLDWGRLRLPAEA